MQTEFVDDEEAVPVSAKLLRGVGGIFQYTSTAHNESAAVVFKKTVMYRPTVPLQLRVIVPVDIEIEYPPVALKQVGAMFLQGSP